MNVPAMPSEAILEELERVLGSGVFRSATRSSQLLRFLVEQTVHGNSDHLKDYTLGAEALGRGEDFDPRTDPIARVEASRLRSRLELYYGTEGATDSVVITLPRGGYIPQFETRRVAAEPPKARRPNRLIWLLLAIVALIASVESVWIWSSGASEPPPEMRLEIATPSTNDAVSLALSPDAKYVAFVATSQGRSQIWLRPLDSAFAHPLEGTDYGVSPFWSPDGRSLGFFADGELKRIDIHGGTVKTLTKVPVPAGGSWNQNDVIVFPMVPDSQIFQISAAGGEPRQLTTLEPHQNGHRAPQFLPDGRHFLYLATGSPEVRGVYVGDLQGSHPRRLIDSEYPAVFGPAGYLFFVNQGTLFAQRYDAEQLELVDHPIPVAEHVLSGARAGLTAVSVSKAGPIAYRTGEGGEKRQLAWFDRSGKELAKIGDAESFGVSYLSLSPDERRLAVQRTSKGNTDIWLLDLRSGSDLRFTTDPGPDIAPLWSPRGDRIVFASHATGLFDLFQKPLGGGEAEQLLMTPQAKQATDWSVDGRFLLYRSFDPQSDWDIWAMPMAGDQKPFPVVRGKFEERDGQFSPDGKWIAYQSNESGQFEIYLQPFPGPGEKVRVSENGGAHVRWRHDGKELFYIALDGRLVSASLHISSGGSLETGTRTPLFFANVGPVQDTSESYVVSTDGQRFLVDTVVEEAASPISVILNWKPPSQ